MVTTPSPLLLLLHLQHKLIVVPAVGANVLHLDKHSRGQNLQNVQDLLANLPRHQRSSTRHADVLRSRVYMWSGQKRNSCRKHVQRAMQACPVGLTTISNHDNHRNACQPARARCTWTTIEGQPRACCGARQQSRAGKHPCALLYDIKLGCPSRPTATPLTLFLA